MLDIRLFFFKMNVHEMKTDFKSTNEFVEYLIILQLSGQLVNDFDEPIRQDYDVNREPRIFELQEGLQDSFNENNKDDMIQLKSGFEPVLNISLTEVINRTSNNINNRSNYDKLVKNVPKIKEYSHELSKMSHGSHIRPNLFDPTEHTKITNKRRELLNEQYIICRDIFRYFIVAYDSFGCDGINDLYEYLMKYYETNYS